MATEATPARPNPTDSYRVTYAPLTRTPQRRVQGPYLEPDTTRDLNPTHPLAQIQQTVGQSNNLSPGTATILLALAQAAEGCNNTGRLPRKLPTAGAPALSALAGQVMISSIKAQLQHTDPAGPLATHYCAVHSGAPGRRVRAEPPHPSLLGTFYNLEHR